MSNLEQLSLLESLLIKDYGEEIAQFILKQMDETRVVSFRVNPIKTTKEAVMLELQKHHLTTEDVPWYADAFILKNGNEKDLEILEIYQQGHIYLQSLSSMIPPLILNPKPKTDILDMAAAPGGKTTQIAAITDNLAFITACEAQSIRAEKLKFNLSRQGAKHVQVIVDDARKLDDFFRFDHILLDAPCSGSGTIQRHDEKTFRFFSEKLILKSSETQTALLDKALKLLKQGQTMVYSTCSILRKENEEIILKAMKKHKIELIPIDVPLFDHCIHLPTRMDNTLLIAPSKYYEGFFIAHIRKK